MNAMSDFPETVFQQNRSTVHAQRCTVYLHKSSIRLIFPLYLGFMAYIFTTIYIYTHICAESHSDAYVLTHTRAQMKSTLQTHTNMISLPGFQLSIL